MRGRLKKPIQVFRQPFSDRDAIKALPIRVRHLFSGSNRSDNFACPPESAFAYGAGQRR